MATAGKGVSGLRRADSGFLALRVFGPWLFGWALSAGAGPIQSASPPELGDGPAVAASASERLGLSFGVWDVEEPSAAFELGVDYEFRPWRYHLVPHLGLHAAEQGVFYGYAGMRYHWRLSRRITAVPSVAVGLYDRGDAPKDLGHRIEFRSGMDLDFRCRGGRRVGFGFYHLSNGRISSQNPGANSLLLRYRFGGARRSLSSASPA